jgi:hypothetical protein
VKKSGSSVASIVKEYCKSIITHSSFLEASGFQNRIAGTCRDLFCAMIVYPDQFVMSQLSIVVYGTFLFDNLELIFFKQSNQFTKLHGNCYSKA